MSRKKKSKPSSAVPGRTDSAMLAGHAGAALGASRHKEAIEHFKELLKTERRPAWLEGLAAAYAGRAEQLAAKGMLKEALALWRTRADACNVPLLGGPYVAWLLESGQTEQALRLLAAVDKLPPEAQAHAHTQLAAAILVASDSLLTGLPADSPLLRQRAAARAALAACARGDATGLEEALQAISFRSPYRDLRPLLKALALQATDPQSAAAALARVPQDVPEKGPFEPLAKALRVCLMPGIEWLAAARQLDDAGRALVLDLKGCPQAQRPLVLDLMQRAADAAPTALELFDVVLRHRRAMTDGKARHLCLHLLPHAPQRQDTFRASFGPLAAAEHERVLALAAELKQKPEQAHEHWLRLVRLLGNAPAGTAGKQRAALVLRRLADDRYYREADGTLDPQALAWLAQSLELDPADHACHLQLVRHARLRGDLKQARSRLDSARKQFPEDAPLLQEAVEIALAAGAFKKAAGLAKQVLQLDPINPRVRTLIGQAHLAHARKQIEANNPQAARREIDEAANWLRTAGERGMVNLLRSFAAEPSQAGGSTEPGATGGSPESVATGDSPQPGATVGSPESGAAADSLLREAMALFGGPLVGAFHLLLECKHIRRKREPGQAADLLRRAGIDLAVTPSAAEVVALAHALNTLPQRDGTLRAALGVLRGMLSRAAGKLRFSESEHLLVCEALHRHEQSDLTRLFTEAALVRWPERPVFVYLDAAARYGANPWSMPRSEWRRLDRVFDQAREQGDQRTATRLSKLLGATGTGGFDADMPPDIDALDDAGDPGPDDLRAVIDMILAFGGEDSFLDMARRQLGKATFDQLRREIRGTKKQFAQALVELLSLADAEPVRPPVRIVPPQGLPAQTTWPAAKKQPDLFDD